MDWTNSEAPSLDDIEALARASFAALPKEFQALAGELVFRVEDFPDDDVQRDMSLETEFDILGLFQGASAPAREGAHAPEPTLIFLYRRPILDYWAESGEALGPIVRHVLIHEIGHYFGFSDDDMDLIEEA
jgi:predicted Zn-dependent protease with MMP-like domain